MVNTHLYTQLLKLMLLEDWRQHTDLFGGKRFAAFPIQITLMVAATTWLLTLTTITPDTIITGIHALVLVFGLHIGTTAFEGDDAMENALGDTTYIMFTARTLPITSRELLSVFLVKDAIYYTGLFVLPVTLGSIPLYVYTPLDVSATLIATLLASLSLTFITGAALAVLCISLLSGTITSRFTALTTIAAVIGGIATGYIPVEATPYGVYIAETLMQAVVPVLATTVLAGVAVLVYTPSKHVHAGTPAPYSERILNALPGKHPRLALKSVMDIHRSSAGMLKPASVSALIVAVVALSTWGVGNTLNITINHGIAYGGLLGLTAFTSHTFLTQYDALDEYLFHPVSVRDVFTAKYVAFALMTIPTGVVFYGAAVAYHTPGVLDVILGGVVFTGLSVYIFGVTVYLTGLDPNGFMFDSVAFGTFAAAVMIALIPVLIASFLPLTGTASLAILLWVTVLGSGGVLACQHAPGKWVGV